MTLAATVAAPQRARNRVLRALRAPAGAPTASPSAKKDADKSAESASLRALARMGFDDIAFLVRTARRLGERLADLALPAACPGCGEPGAGLCRRCDQDLVRRGEPPCPRCGEATIVAGAPCPSDHRELRHLRWHAAPWRYAGAGGGLVRRFKLDGDAAAGRFVARAMADALRAQAPWPCPGAVFVPVPLHRARLRQRGFDQTAWLARRIAARLGAPCAVGALVRQRATLPQGDPRVGSRESNVEDAFVVRRPRAVRLRHVVLVDDVFTSGATARECARVLLLAGARSVAVLTACRS